MLLTVYCDFIVALCSEINSANQRALFQKIDYQQFSVILLSIYQIAVARKEAARGSCWYPSTIQASLLLAKLEVQYENSYFNII